MFIISIVYDTRIALHREIIYLLYCSYKSSEYMLYLQMYYYTFTHGRARTAHGRARTFACACHGQHGHWPVRATDARTCHGHATDISCGPTFGVHISLGLITQSLAEASRRNCEVPASATSSTNTNPVVNLSSSLPAPSGRSLDSTWTSTPCLCACAWSMGIHLLVGTVMTASLLRLDSHRSRPIKHHM